MAKDTDQELVRRVQKGDRRAFDLLFSRYQHKIHGLVSRYVRTLTKIDDVVQEAFIKAYRALPRFRGESAFYTWLYRIAINTAKNYLVARGRRPPDVDVDVADAEHFEGSEPLRDSENPENSLARDELENAINTGDQSIARRFAQRCNTSRIRWSKLRTNCRDHGLPGRYGAFADIQGPRSDRRTYSTADQFALRYGCHFPGWIACLSNSKNHCRQSWTAKRTNSKFAGS